MPTLSQQLKQQGAISDYDVQIKSAIAQVTERLIQPPHRVKIDFCDCWSYGWGKPTDKFSGWNVKYMNDIIAHFRKEGMRVSQSYKFEVYDITIEL